jgi:adenosylcobinamide-GDP ribazoletransferase
MRIFSHIINVLAYLTILPLGRDERLTQEDFGRMPGYYPVAGLALGLSLFLLHKLLSFLGSPDSVTATLAVTLLVIMTRGFHLDGLADSMDALLSHRSREEKLAIMKDPHQGTFGVLAIVLDILLKVSLLTSIFARPDYFIPLILFPVWSRLASSTVSAFSRYARAGGGLAYASVEFATYREFLIAFGITLGLSLLFGVPAFLMALVAFAASLVFIWLWGKIMLGVTGDLLGATLEITEVMCLFLYVLVF